METPKIIIIGVLIALAYLCLKNQGFELYTQYPAPLLYDHWQANQNSFRNYYRIGYEQSVNIGWKPSMNWDHLRPESNECPDCYPDDVPAAQLGTKEPYTSALP